MPLTGPQAIGAVIGVIAAHEVTAADGQLISHVWDRWMAERPVLTITATVAGAAITVAHLCNGFEYAGIERLDPYAGFGFAALAVIKRHIARS